MKQNRSTFYLKVPRKKTVEEIFEKRGTVRSKRSEFEVVRT